jgi:hypothetical protein
LAVGNERLAGRLCRQDGIQPDTIP